MSEYRGRLIRPSLARLVRLDPEATMAVDGGPEAAGLGYDLDFREPAVVPTAGQLGVSARRELPAVDLPCQVEGDGWQVLQMMRTGDSPRSRLTLVFHFAYLEDAGLVHPDTGAALAPQKGDRVASLHQMDGTLELAVPTPPGLYCVSASPASFGLTAARKNLLLCVFEPRAVSQG